MNRERGKHAVRRGKQADWPASTIGRKCRHFSGLEVVGDHGLEPWTR